MSGCIHNIDLDQFTRLGVGNGDGSVLGQNGDTSLAFERIRIHHAVNHLLVFAEDACLFQ